MVFGSAQRRPSSIVIVVCVLCHLCERDEVSLRETSDAAIFPVFRSQQADESLLCAWLLYSFPKQYMILGGNSSGLLNGSVGGHESHSLCAGERKRERKSNKAKKHGGWWWRYIIKTETWNYLHVKQGYIKS